MGENTGTHALILDNPPEKLRLINRLYNYDRNKTWTEKFWSVFKNSDVTQSHSITQWCKILGKKENNGDARDLIQDLWDLGAMEKVDETHNGFPELVLDRAELVRCYRNSVFYNACRDLNFAAIDMFEDNRKVVTDW